MSANVVNFLNSFMSYLFVYFVFGACVVAAFFAGMFLRKRKDKKDAAEITDTEAVTEE